MTEAWNSASTLARPAANLKYADQPNDHPSVGAQYPKVLYRKTGVEKRSVQTDANAKCGETWTVDNKFDGLLCDTIIADDADHAEQLASDGWDTSPKAAYGIVAGIVAATTAKDDEIAALKAQIVEQAEQKRGPGRPPKAVESVEA